jgi:hypothetical protein
MASERAEISLAKAMKLKNRLAGRLAKLDKDLETFNSVVAGADQPDIKGLYVERAKVVTRLIDLKVAINAANQPAQRTIVELGEAKSVIALLGRMSTKHGTMVEPYHGTAVQYVAQFRKVDVDQEVRRLEGEIDRLQDQLDGFNHKTTITIDAAILSEIERTAPASGA